MSGSIIRTLNSYIAFIRQVLAPGQIAIREIVKQES